MTWWRQKREDDLDRELRSHLEAETEDQQGDRHAARRALGNLGQVKENVREAWGWMWLERLGQDLRYALRTMRQNPGFTATAVLSLALGIGANTAIFSLIDALMLRWLPVHHPEELVLVRMRPAGAEASGETFSYLIVRTLAAQKDIFAGVGGFSASGFLIGPPGSVSQVSGAWVTGAYYETLDVNPAMGRLLSREDDEDGAPLVAVLSDGYWRRQFAQDPGIIGQKMLVNRVSVTIVGVSPPGFVGANVGAIADITMPIANIPRVNPTMSNLLNPGNFWLRALARPREGVSAAQAKARLEAVWPQVAEGLFIGRDAPPARKKAIAGATFQLDPGGTGYTVLRAMFRKPLFVLLALVGFVLLIACANVANLMLARAAAREREIAVRLAIGAGRARIVRQLLTESMLLAVSGAVLGVGLAWFTGRLLLEALSDAWGRVMFDLTPNWHVVGFTAAVAIATGVLFGLAPALHMAAARPSASLKEDSRSKRSRSRLLSSLVSAQVALSLVLVIGAGLFVRSLQNLQNLDPGFQRQGVLLVTVNGEREGYRDASLTAFNQDLLDQVQQVPGVVSASISNNTPLSGGTWTEAAVPKGQQVPGHDNANFVAVGPHFFETLQTPLVSGREFTRQDEGSPSVAIVNEAFARRHFPGKNPVGEYLSATVKRPPADLEIIGVVRDVSTDGLRSAAPPTVYVSYFQHPHDTTALEIRAAGSLTQVAAAVRKELQPKLPGTPVEVRALTDQVKSTLVQERMMAALASGFGALALILACIGLYGLLAYSAARRTKEMGIRLALGAQRRVVIVMVVKSAVHLVVFGIALGLPAAWAASRLVESMLFGLTPTDPATIVGAAMLLAAAALIAAYLPARRAARVDPLTALRHD